MSVIVARSIPSISNGIFGKNFIFAENLGVTTTTLTTFQTKVTLNTGIVPVGTYRIGWSYQWNHNSTVDDFEGRVVLDAVNILDYIQAEPKDSAANNGAIGPPNSPFSTTGTDQRFSTSGFVHVPLTAIAHSILIDFRTNNTAKESSIWNARLEFWRVA